MEGVFQEHCQTYQEYVNISSIIKDNNIRKRAKNCQPKPGKDKIGRFAFYDLRQKKHPRGCEGVFCGLGGFRQWCVALLSILFLEYLVAVSAGALPTDVDEAGFEAPRLHVENELVVVAVGHDDAGKFHVVGTL